MVRLTNLEVTEDSSQILVSIYMAMFQVLSQDLERGHNLRIKLCQLKNKNHTSSSPEERSQRQLLNCVCLLRWTYAISAFRGLIPSSSESATLIFLKWLPLSSSQSFRSRRCQPDTNHRSGYVTQASKERCTKMWLQVETHTMKCNKNSQWPHSRASFPSFRTLIKNF